MSLTTNLSTVTSSTTRKRHNEAGSDAVVSLSSFTTSTSMLLSLRMITRSMRVMPGVVSGSWTYTRTRHPVKTIGTSWEYRNIPYSWSMPLSPANDIEMTSFDSLSQLSLTPEPRCRRCRKRLRISFPISTCE